MLQAKDLTKRYEDGHLAVDHINFEVQEGEIFCMLGANGAGKTSTINLFLNFIDPTEGQALVDGIDSYQGPAGGQGAGGLRLRKRHALRQLHLAAEHGLLCQAGRQAQPKPGRLLRGHAPGGPARGRLRAQAAHLLQGHAPEDRHRHRHHQGRAQHHLGRAHVGVGPQGRGRVHRDPHGLSRPRARPSSCPPTTSFGPRPLPTGWAS